MTALTAPRAVSHLFGYTPRALDRTASEYARRIVAMGEARKWRAEYFSMADWCRRFGWDATVRRWGEPDEDGVMMDGLQWRDACRALWRDAIWAMNRHAY